MAWIAFLLIFNCAGTEGAWVLPGPYAILGGYVLKRLFAELQLASCWNCYLRGGLKGCNKTKVGNLDFHRKF